ncbi:MAG: DUF1641 domain-containing protein [Chloroflexi bacterium]|nr:MAG: DUF1641 domain-containing protein [Chloroflexota bacterium]
MSAELTELNAKLDYLIEQVDAQRQRQAMLEELWRDMQPVIRDASDIAVQELAEVDGAFRMEDLVALMKAFLRNTRTFVKLVEQMEALMDLMPDVNRIMTPAMDQMVEQLALLEEKGFFKFANGMLYIADQVLSAFDEEDVRALGDNIVTILTTVRNMTQPEVMALANRAIESVEAPVEEDVSVWRLMREMRDPATCKGMARMLQMLKALGEQETLGTN